MSNCKGKYLTRSHAISESTSPPCTPSPEGDSNCSKKNNNHSSTSPSTYLEVPLQRNWQDKQTIIVNGDEDNGKNESHSDLELGQMNCNTKTPLPTNLSDSSSFKDMDNNDDIEVPSSSIGDIETDVPYNNEYEECIDGQNMGNIEDDSEVDEIVDQKGRPNAYGKSNESRGKGKNQYNNSESSDNLNHNEGSDYYTDQNGVDLLQFFKNTLNKNSKDRHMLLRIERELTTLAQDESRNVVKFPTMSSYNRMLIHRVAAWFGMDHNVDGTLQCVIVDKTKDTRIPNIKFKTLLADTYTDEPLSRKSILKRDAYSFEEYRQRFLGCFERGNMMNRKAKSFEEREQEYNRIKKRIFKDMENESFDQISPDCSDELSSEEYKYSNTNRKNIQNNRSFKNQSASVESRADSRLSVSKSHSFGGYGSQSRLPRGDSVTSTKSAGPTFLQNKNLRVNQQPWRLSISSSGYKSQSQSLQSSSITPSPSYASITGDTLDQLLSSTSTVLWAITDISKVPKGSILIDPQTLQPVINQDGSVYNFDPTDLPAINTLQIAGTALSANLNKYPNGVESHYNKIEEIQDMGEELEDDDYAVATASSIEQNFLTAETDATATENASQQAFANISFHSTTSSNNENAQGTENITEDAYAPVSLDSENVTPVPNDPKYGGNALSNSNASYNNNSALSIEDDTIQLEEDSATPIDSEYEESNDKNADKELSVVDSDYTTEATLEAYTPIEPVNKESFEPEPEGTVFAVPQPLMEDFPAMPQNDEQTTTQNGLLPIVAPGTPAASTIYQSACSTLAVLPYPSNVVGPTANAPYVQQPNLYQGQMLYTSDQYNSMTTVATQAPQYINYPIGYSYPLSAYSPYWGQSAPYYLPLPGTNTVFPISSPAASNEQAQPTAPGLPASTHFNNNYNNNNNTISNNSKSSKPSPTKSYSKTSTTTPAHYPGAYPNDVKVYHTVNQHTVNSTTNPYKTSPVVHQSTTNRNNKHVTLAPSRQSTMLVVAASQHTQHTSPPLQTIPQSVAVSNSNMKTHHSQHTQKKKPNPLLHQIEAHAYSGSNEKTHSFQPESNEVTNSNGPDPTRHYSKLDSRSNENSNSEFYLNENRDSVNTRYSNDSNESKNSVPPLHNENAEFKPVNELSNTNVGANSKSNYGIGYIAGDTNNSDSNYHSNNVRETAKAATSSYTGRSGPRGIIDKPFTSNSRRLDFNRNGNMFSRNTPSSNSTSSSNTSAEPLYNVQPNFQQSLEMQHDPHAFYIARSVLPPIHPTHISDAYQPVTYNSNPGMYVKLGSQAYVTHTLVFPNNPQANDLRPRYPLHPVSGVYPNVNMALQGYPRSTRPAGPQQMSHISLSQKKNRLPR